MPAMNLTKSQLEELRAKVGLSSHSIRSSEPNVGHLSGQPWKPAFKNTIGFYQYFMLLVWRYHVTSEQRPELSLALFNATRSVEKQSEKSSFLVFFLPLPHP